MKASPTPLDASRCPLCGGANGCAMEAGRLSGQPQPPCWCAGLDFSADLLARVPQALKNQACICAACRAASAAGQGS